ncbi:amino acid adenylation domain protein [Calothrix sp. NIES-4071]|nr:amino acid adenylation domain protein [Calothrix sp. NIES-4071]
MKHKNVEDAYPLSPMQQGMLFHSLYAPDEDVYIEQMSFNLNGTLNVAAFVRAWQQVVERHPILRTAFVWEKLEKPIQVVGRQVTLPWEEHDFRGVSPDQQQKQLEVLQLKERLRGFDISKAPLMRFTLIRLQQTTYHFIWSHHHLLLDGWSVPLVLKEVIAYYKAFCQGENLYLERPRPYRDYIGWLQQQNIAQAEVFWRSMLKGFTTPTPLRKNLVSQRLPNQKVSYCEQERKLSATCTAALQTLAHQHQVTLNTFIQGSVALLLSRYSGEEDVVFGATVSGRPPTLAKAESMVGLFINTLPVRVKVNPGASVLPWLHSLQTQQVEAREYEYTPLVQIQGWSEVPRGLPLFETIVVFENYPIDASLHSPGIGLEISNVCSFDRTNYPLTISVVPGEELLLKIAYTNGDGFDTATIERMLGHLVTLLESIIANPHQHLEELSILTPAERHYLLVELNQSSTFNTQQCIHHLFEKQVVLAPDAVAVVFGTKSLTYEQLNQKANQLAHHLISLGVKPEMLVGICVERSLEMVIGILGILKAGGAYVPIDPDYPQERLAFMIADANVSVLLTQEQLLHSLPNHQARIICLDADWDAIAQQLPLNPVNTNKPENLAYVIYTSGSTGQSKGVMIEHRSLVNAYFAWEQTYQLRASKTCHLQMASFSFDVFSGDLVRALCSGGKLVLSKREFLLSPKELYNLMVFQQVECAEFVPAVLRNLVEYLEQSQLSLDFMKLLVCGSDVWYGQEYQKFRSFCGSQTRLINSFGATEATIDSSWFEATTHSALSSEQLVPIGRAFPNTQVYILDVNLQPVPVGVAGEIYIGGTSLARGYLNRPELTAQKFIPNPYSRSEGRLYKTGDLACYLPDGNIEFIRRIDNQVKIRGFRIEIAEIEAVLIQHQVVREVVVLAREDLPGDKRLVAYVVNDTPTTVPELRHFLKQKLPEYMVPGAFVFLEALPLTPNGKVDRKALPAPEIATIEQDNFKAPRTNVEEILAGIWSDILGVKQVSIDDNFFDLGGHSLIATQLISRIRKVFQVEVPLRYLFEEPTVAGLGAKIQASQQLILLAAPIQPIARLEKTEFPLSFAQQRLWFLQQLHPENSSYNIFNALHMKGSLNIAALETSLNEIIKRHEALRTSFIAIDGYPVQVIAPKLQLTIPVIDLQTLPEAEQKAQVLRLIAKESEQPFDLACSPLARVTLLKLNPAEYILLCTMHHIISDGWSMEVLVGELATFYRASVNRKPLSLPELPVQYADFAVWQRQWLQEDVLAKQLAYWKQQLGGTLPALQLPYSQPRPEKETSRCIIHSFKLSVQLSQALQTLSREANATLFITMLAAFKTLLYRYSKQDDIVVGTDVANRNQAETEGLIGFFVNILVLRTYLGGYPSFRELLQRVREVAIGAYAHQDLPFEKLVEELQPERHLNHTPLFEVLFVMDNVPKQNLELPDLTIAPLEVNYGTAKFDLALFVAKTEQEIVGSWHYNADLFDAKAIARMTGHFETLLNSIVAQPDARINTLEMLTETEKKQQIMAETKQEENKLKKFMQVKPKAVKLPQGELIKTYFLQPGESLPLVVEPAINDIDITDWAKNNRQFIETKLQHHGAILFRNCNIDAVLNFENLAQAICPNLFAEYGDLPREGISDKVYGSTPYPADQAILFHNESSHLHQFPLKIWFYCVQPAARGGETPIVDCRKVYQLLNPKLREKLEKQQLMYVRNYIEGLDVSWQDFFRTTDKAVVENYCKKAKIEFEWLANNGLKTRQIRQAIAQHPYTKEAVFFNQIQLHHISCLNPTVRESLLSIFGENSLPRNVYYGDGSPIEDAVMSEINQVYRQATISFPWQQGDVLMLDNMLTAHGRFPYQGQRKIVVAMGEIHQL